MNGSAGRRHTGEKARNGLWVLLCTCIFATPISAQRNAVEGIIRGQIIDHETGEGIAGALVEVLDDKERIHRSVTADDSGYFAIRRVRPGPFWLRASRIGYARSKTPPWQLASGEALTVELRLNREAVVLAPLKVMARAITVSPVLSNYRERVQRRMGGFFITREDIVNRKPARVTDLLETVPGITVQSGRGMASARMVSVGRGMQGAGGSSCPVQIYVDGILATRGRQPVSPDDLVAPETLEGIEVYRGLSTVPAEFLTPEARCGVIAIWTRRGG